MSKERVSSSGTYKLNQSSESVRVVDLSGAENQTPTNQEAHNKASWKQAL